MISRERELTGIRAAGRARKLGNGIYWTAWILFWLLTAGMVIGAIVIYNAYAESGYSGGWETTEDWESIWYGWGVLFGVWLTYTFGLAMIALVGSVAEAKGESLAIQIEQAKP